MELVYVFHQALVIKRKIIAMEMVIETMIELLQGMNKMLSRYFQTLLF